MAKSEVNVTVKISSLDLFKELIESVFMSAYLAGLQKTPCLTAKRDVENEVLEYLKKEEWYVQGQ